MTIDYFTSDFYYFANLRVERKFVHYPQISHKWLTKCPQITHKLSADCIQIARKLHTKCPQIAHELPTNNIKIPLRSFKHLSFLDE